MLSERQVEIIRFIQGDLPLVERPFAQLAERLGITEEQAAEEIRAMQEEGVIRRFGAALRHRNIGYAANGMSCWNVPENKIESAAETMVQYDEVTHCYERPRFDGWDYNLYAMIHGQERREVLDVARQISERIGVDDFLVLFSTREYKRASMRYFLEED